MPITQFSKATEVNLLHAETIVLQNVASGNSAADIITEDAVVHSMLITNYGGQATAKVTVKDRAGAPRSFVVGANTIVGVGGAVMMESESGIPATGGINAVCDTTSACEIKIVWRRPRYS